MKDCKQIEELIPGWLYGELDEADARRVEAEVDQCASCRDLLGSFERVRQAARELPEADPPASLTAKLLHEAARSAPTPERARPLIGVGLWARVLRWLRPITMHPAAAAMATLVLVVGVVGALALRGDAPRVAEPQLAAEAVETGETPAAAPAPMEPRAEADLTLEESGAPDDDDLADQWRAGDEAAATDRGEGGERKKEYAVDLEGAIGAEKGARRDAKSKPARPGKRKADVTATVRAAPLADLEREEAPVASRTTAGGVPVERSLDVMADDADPAKDGFALPPADAAGEAQAQDERRAERQWAATTHRRLDAAARARKCRQAATLANDLLERAPAYFQQNVARDKDLEPCAAYVAQERRRRSSARKSRAQPAYDAAEQAAEPTTAQ